MQQNNFRMSATLEHSQSIIQCPQCQTKFAVDSAVLAQVSAPRFHCSRCDYLFTAETKPASPTIVAHSILDRPALQEQTKPFNISDESTKPVAAPEPAKQPEWSLGLPHVEQQAPIAPRIPAGLHPAPRDSIEHKQMNFDFKRAPQSGALNPQPSAFDAPEQARPARQTAVTTSAMQARPAMSDSLAPQDFALGFDYRRPSSRWNGLMIAAAPLIFFLSIIIGASYYLRSNSHGAETLFASLSKSSTQVAPPEVNIVNARFKEITLESGETAFIVSGTLKNHSQHTLSDITLEGIGFSEDGSPVTRTRVDAGATLAKTRIRSLTQEMIRNLQSGQLKSKVTLKPGDSEDFSFALLNGEAAKARYFSARVYSVRF